MSGRKNAHIAGRAAALRDADTEHDLLARWGDALDNLARGRLDVLAPEPAAECWQRIGHYSRAGEAAKLALDLVLAASAVVLLGPLMLVIAAAIRLETPGPALVGATRIGRGGRPFRLWRFRELPDEAPRRPGRAGGRSIDGLLPHDEPDPDVDPRLTRVGRVLRRSGLDELPGLFNVLACEMSLVGPRPELPELVPYCGAAAKLVLAIRPGLVSLVRLHGRPRMPFHESLELDLRYLRERSLRTDARLLLAMLLRAASGRGPAA